jgi:hypothetical protein
MARKSESETFNRNFEVYCAKIRVLAREMKIKLPACAMKLKGDYTLKICACATSLVKAEIFFKRLKRFSHETIYVDDDRSLHNPIMQCGLD